MPALLTSSRNVSPVAMVTRHDVGVRTYASFGTAPAGRRAL